MVNFTFEKPDHKTQVLKARDSLNKKFAQIACWLLRQLAVCMCNEQSAPEAANTETTIAWDFSLKCLNFPECQHWLAGCDNHVFLIRNPNLVITMHIFCQTVHQHKIQIWRCEAVWGQPKQILNISAANLIPLKSELLMNYAWNVLNLHCCWHGLISSCVGRACY